MNFLKVFFYIFLVFKYECLSVRKNKNIDIQGLFDALTLMTKMLNADRNILKTVLPNQSVQTCGMSCPKNSTLKKLPNPGSDINGCGSYNIKINFGIFNAAEFDECCNFHDSCYEDCAATKDLCDIQFSDCLINHCISWGEELKWGGGNTFYCKGVVKILVGAVNNFGCAAYKAGQLLACQCDGA